MRGDIKLFLPSFATWENEKDAKRCWPGRNASRWSYNEGNSFPGNFLTHQPLRVNFLFDLWLRFFTISDATLILKKEIIFTDQIEGRGWRWVLWGAWLFFIIRTFFIRNEHSLIPLRRFSLLPFSPFVSRWHLRSHNGSFLCITISVDFFSSSKNS